MALMPLRIGLAAGGVAAVVIIGAAVLLLREPDPPPIIRASATITATAPQPASTAPSGASPIAPAPAAAPTFDVVRVSPSGSAVFAGRAEPLSTVTIQDNGQEIGTAHADSRGEWVFLPNAPLAPGARQLSLLSRADSGASRGSESDVVLVVPERVPQGAPPAPVMAVLITPSAPARMLQGPAAPPGRVTMDVVDYDAQGQIRFTGAGPAGSPVRVYIDNALAGEARTDAGGHWSLQPSSAVKPGVHAVRVDQLGPTGRVTSRIEMPFARADMPSLEAGRVVVQPGENLWRLARHAYGSGIRYTVIYRANQDQIRDPKRIYPGQAFNIPSGS